MRSLKSRARVTILRSSVGSPPAMAFVNELKKRGVRVIGIDSDPLSSGLYLCDKGYIVPRADHPRYLSELLKICKIERPEILLPGPDKATLIITKNRKLFEKLGVLVLAPDYKTCYICINKKETQKQLYSLGIPIPKVYTRKTARFPCIVKPSYGSGANGVAIVHNRSEMDRHLAKIKEPIIQEYVEGPEYSVDVFADLNAIPLSIVPRVRIHTESGVSMKGETVYDKKIIDYCELIVRKLHLVGPTCIQCIKGKDGIRFLEINIRFGGGSVLSLTANPSVVSNLIKIARGQRPIPHREFKKGLIMLRYYSQVFVTKDKVLKK